MCIYNAEYIVYRKSCQVAEYPKELFQIFECNLNVNQINNLLNSL